MQLYQVAAAAPGDQNPGQEPVAQQVGGKQGVKRVPGVQGAVDGGKLLLLKQLQVFLQYVRCIATHQKWRQQGHAV